MKIKDLILTAWFVVFPAILTPAQGETQHSLINVVEKAISQNEQIAAQKSRIEEKRESSTQVLSWDNPSFQIGTGLKFADGITFPVAEIGLSQLFYFPGKQRLRKEVLDFETSFEEIKLRDVELAVASTVVRLAYEHSINQRKLELAERRLAHCELISTFLAGRTIASSQQKVLNMVVKDRLRNIRISESQAKRAMKASADKLKNYLGESDPIHDIQVPWLKGIRTISMADWQDKVFNQSTELRAQRIKLTQAKKSRELLEKEVWPDFRLSVSYSQESPAQTERVVGFSLSIPLPVFNRNQWLIRGAEHKIASEKSELIFAEGKMRSLVETLLSDYASQQSVVVEYSESSLKDLMSQVDSMEKEFRKNRVDFALYLDLDIQVAETLNKIFDSQMKFMNTLVSLYVLARDKNLISELATY